MTEGEIEREIRALRERLDMLLEAAYELTAGPTWVRLEVAREILGDATVTMARGKP